MRNNAPRNDALDVLGKDLYSTPHCGDPKSRGDVPLSILTMEMMFLMASAVTSSPLEASTRTEPKYFTKNVIPSHTGSSLHNQSSLSSKHMCLSVRNEGYTYYILLKLWII